MDAEKMSVTGAERVPSPSVEDLKNKRADLEARVAAAKQAKEADIAKKVNDREELIAEDTRLVPLIEEAQGTLEYYVAQNEQGILISPDDQAELESLKHLLADLEAQKKEKDRKYDEIMGQPEVYGKIWDEAHQMDKEKMDEAEAAQSKVEFEARVEATRQELEAKVAEFTAHLEAFYVDRNKTSSECYQTVQPELGNAIDKLEEIIKLARKPLQYRGLSEAWNKVDLRNFRQEGMEPYFQQLEQYKSELGTFQLRERAAVNYVLMNRAKFEPVEALRKKYEELLAKIRENDVPGDLPIGQEYARLNEEMKARQEELFGPSSDQGNRFTYRIIERKIIEPLKGLLGSWSGASDLLESLSRRKKS